MKVLNFTLLLAAFTSYLQITHGQFSQVPECGRGCVSNQVSSLGCALSDTTCLCTKNFPAKVASCLIVYCTEPGEIDAAIAAVANICSPSTSLSSSTSSTSPTSTPNPTPEASPSPGLSTGAKAGIGTGVGVGVVLLCLIAYITFVLRKRRKRKMEAQAQQQLPDAGIAEMGQDGSGRTEMLVESKNDGITEEGAKEGRGPITQRLELQG